MTVSGSGIEIGNNSGNNTLRVLDTGIFYNNNRVATVNDTADITLSNVISIDSNSAVQTALNNKADITDLDSCVFLDYSNADYTPVNKAGDTMSGSLTVRTSENVPLHLIGNYNYSQQTTAGHTYSDLMFQDYTGTRRNSIRSDYIWDENGNLIRTSFLFGSNGIDDAAPAGIQVTRDASGGTITAQFTPASTNSITASNIPTTGWVNNPALSTNVVHRTDTETIAGRKIFTDDPFSQKATYPRYVLKCTDWTRGTNPSTNSNAGLTIQDSNTDNGNLHRLGEFVTQLNADGSGYSEMRNYKNEVTNTSTYIRVGYNANGNAYTYAPASDITNSIVTTVAKSKAANGYYKLGNGLIIQWGYTGTLPANSTATITLPTAFTSTNYIVVANGRTDSQTNSGGVDTFHSQGLTTTTFNITHDYSSNAQLLVANWIAIGY